MVKFWTERNTVYSNLQNLDLSKVTPRELVKLSIQHWEFIRDIGERNSALLSNLNCGGGSTCALCQRYNACGCLKCPVAIKTHYPYCRNTPYMDYLDPGLTPKVIRAEIAFLYEVLEEVEDGV